MTTGSMVGLGRVYDVVYTAAANPFSVRNCSAVSLICKASGAATLTLQAQKTFSGTPANWTTANGFGQTAYWYENQVNTGAGAWAKKTASWASNVLTISGTTGYVSVVPIFTTQFADGYDYLLVETATNCVVTAVLHDLTVQRTPANLAILGA